MRYTPILLISLLALQSCSLHDRLDSAASDLEQQYAELRLWDNLPLRTISWNQAVSMMKRSNASFTRARMSIEKAERSELSVYTDLIPGVSYYSYFNRSISDLTKAVNSDDITHNVNISFSIPTLTQVPYRVYASQARTYSAIKALEGKERELIAELYTLQRTLALESRIEQHNQKKPEQNKQPASPLNKTASQHSQWLKMATLLGDYSARWRILPSSIPQFKWSDYRKRTGQLDQLIICQLAMAHENLSRVCVKPQESQTGTGQRTANHDQFTGARDVRDQQVIGKVHAAFHISEHAQSRTNHHTRQNSQTVQTVSQIHGITRTDNHDIGQHHKAEDTQRISKVLKERNDQIGLRRHL